MFDHSNASVEANAESTRVAGGPFKNWPISFSII